MLHFGPVPPSRLPKQDPMRVLQLAERWQRAAHAHERWATPAKKCFDFFEGRHWTADEIAKRTREKKPSLKWNKIAPLVRLIVGYQRSNRTDITFKPGQDARATEDVAEALTRIDKQISQANEQEFVDAEVFLDGLVGGRGWFDTRLDFAKNDLGDVKTTAADPFSTFPDPDADTYDLNESASYVQTSKWLSLDEIEWCYGKKVAELIAPFTRGHTPLSPIASLIVDDEVSPVRTFGQREDADDTFWDSLYGYMGLFVDTYRKTIRCIDTQWKVYEQKNVIIDLETGDSKVLPDSWGQDRIQKALLFGQQIGNPLIVQRRMVPRIQWTTMMGDVILYDRPSFYDGFTITGYFPYFRRGMTRGMVDDLIDPQMEKNKRGNAEIEMVSKNANGGWMYHQDSLDPVEERKLQKFGSAPGQNLKWKGTPEQKPQIIANAAPPVAHERLEKKNDEDLRQIAGINEAALGEMDRVQSGRALEARQRQAVLSVQMYMDNFSRSKSLLGAHRLSIVQNHYTESRFYRVMGEDGKFSTMLINEKQVDPTSGITRILNDVTVGKYLVSIDNKPLSATFLNAQYEEMLALLEKMGPALGQALPMFSDLIIDMSSMPRKDEWIKRIQAIFGPPPGGTQPPGQPGGAPGAPQPGGPQGPGGQPPLGLPAPAGDPNARYGIASNVVPFQAPVG